MVGVDRDVDQGGWSLLMVGRSSVLDTEIQPKRPPDDRGFRFQDVNESSRALGGERLLASFVAAVSRLPHPAQTRDRRCEV